MDVIAYHNKTAAEHKGFRDTYLPKGFKYTTLSVYGDPANPLYAGVLISGFAPNAQVEFHGMAGSDWQNTFNTQLKAGRGPVIVTATGPIASATYAAVFETMASVPYTQTGLSASAFDTLNQQAQTSGGTGNPVPNTILSWTGSFGTADDPRYIGIWKPNPQRIVWNVSRLPPTDDQAWFEASNFQSARQVFSVYAPDRNEYLSVYRDDAPIEYVAEGALTAADYQTAFDSMWKAGFIPSCVQGSGTGGNIRITPTFVKTGSTGDRVFTKQGPTPPAALAGFDSYMQAFMTKNRVRAGSLAVVKGKRLVLARGYTYGEPGYAITQPDSIFRIASCSKLLTAVAVLQQTEHNLKLTDTVLDKLPFTIPPNTPGYSFVAALTVDDLLSMISGYDGSVMAEVSVASHLGLTAFPITRDQRAKAMLQTQHLTAAAGTTERYCNLGYSLLAMVVEKVSGNSSYASYVKANILGKVGATTRPRLDVAATGGQPAGAVRQHDDHARNAREVLTGSPTSNTRPYVPLVYGGADYSTYDGYGGWSMAAVDFAAFLAGMNASPCPYFTKAGTLALLSTQNNAYATTLAGKTLEDPGWARGWSLDKSGPVEVRWWGGTLSDIGCYFSLDANQVGIVAFTNTNMNNLDASYWAGLRGVASAVSDWGSANLFAQYGLSIP